MSSAIKGLFCYNCSRDAIARSAPAPTNAQTGYHREAGELSSAIGCWVI
ncbi:hypothetical protein [Microcoleus sp. bin38.metabat.b11b12b14.051]|nr:hypothetical protein [Microcoleus sp. bin38.metabat.b11b12b14.051]